ncbi:MAG: hypothetical protein J7M25_02650 [Deltaproteobacteria bacterium]|nr:hypothetical protein [Deltaproteobacteria bacterium]
MRRLIIVLMLAGLAVASFWLATCKDSGENRAEKYYEPVGAEWMTISVPLVTEADLGAL